MYESLLEVGFAEVGPENRGEVEFGVGNLPEEEVGDALFAARAYQQVGTARVISQREE